MPCYFEPLTADLLVVPRCVGGVDNGSWKLAGGVDGTVQSGE